MTDAIPMPLNIRLDLAHDHAWSVVIEATSTQYPELVGTSPNPEEALEELMQHIARAAEAIQDAKPLSSAMVDALLEEGHSVDLIEAWEQVATGDLRQVPNVAVSTLRKYASHGVPPLTACEFLRLPLGIADAGKICVAGHSAEEAVPYIDASATHKWWMWDFDVVEWMLAGVPAGRVHIYLGHCSHAEAASWEPVAAMLGLTDDDLRDILQAGFTMNDVQAQTAAYAANGMSVADAARTQLALCRP